MLRLTGLPSTKRFPRVHVGRAEDGLTLRFSGPGEEDWIIDVPGWTLAGEDLETVALTLLSHLAEMGYDAAPEP
jgi:hypothetical protein